MNGEEKSGATREFGETMRTKVDRAEQELVKEREPTVNDHDDENTTTTTTTVVLQERSLIKVVVIVLVLTFSLIVNTGNVTSVAIALPTIGREFFVDPGLLQWIASAYPLSSGCLLLVCGRLADLYGRKKAYLIGTLFLAAFTLGCGFADNIITLIVLRALQGIGAAATIPASLGILANSFPPGKTRSLAFATFGAGAPVGAGLGTVLGGVLTEKTSKTWRSSFYVFAAVNAVCFVGGLFCVDKDREETLEGGRKQVDWLGAALITVALVLIMFVLGEGEEASKQWATGYIIALLIVGVFLVGVFIWWQLFLEKAQNRVLEGRGTKRDEKLPPPVMKVSLWGRAKGRFAAVMVIAFCTWSAFIAWQFWVQLYYQNYTGLEPIETVARFIPTFVIGMAYNAFVGFMASRVPMIAILTMGTTGTATGCLLFALINPKVTYWAFGFPAMVLSVLGVDFVFSAGTLYIAKISLPHEQSLAGALFQTMAQLGTSAGITISTVVFNRVTSRLREGEDIIRSYKAAQWTCFAFAAFAALLSLAGFRGVGVPGQKNVKSPSSASSELESREGSERSEEDKRGSEEKV